MDSVKLERIDGINRWQVYHRLQELEIPCQCGSCQPLQVDVMNPSTMLQVWSVLKHCTASRMELVQWLEQCWHESN